MNAPKGYLDILTWDEEKCRAYLEGMRWPNGARCPKCGATEPYRMQRKSRTKNLVKTLFKCRACKVQFSATVGTIFSDTKIPLNKWFAAIYLMGASKKGISAHQIHRMLEISYPSAWFMCHRVREAMRNKSFELLKGVVEADETYVGGKPRGHWTQRERIKDEIQMGLREKPKTHPRFEKEAVFGMIERGGKVRTMHIGKGDDVSRAALEPLLLANIDMKNAKLITDAHKAYGRIRKHLPHDVIRHESEYVRGEVHTQNIEGYWSIIKRGIYGVFQHVDAGYLGNYLNEFEFRFNSRKASDLERFALLMGQTQGRVLWFCQTPQPENPFA